ncbi:MAG: hypothetical protein AAFZ09_12995, partial [Pseudomonadota bacterium]
RDHRGLRCRCGGRDMGIGPVGQDGGQRGLEARIGRHGADAGGRFVATGAPVDVDVPVLAGAGSAEAVLRDAEGAELARLPAVPGAPLSVPASLTGEHAGKTLTLSIAYETAAEVEGEPVIVERPAVVLSEIVAVAGSTEGAVLRRADGLELPPERIAGARPRRRLIRAGTAQLPPVAKTPSPAPAHRTDDDLRIFQDIIRRQAGSAPHAGAGGPTEERTAGEAHPRRGACRP